MDCAADFPMISTQELIELVKVCHTNVSIHAHDATCLKILGVAVKDKKMDDFLSVETSSKNARKLYSVEKKIYFPYLLKTVFGAHACLYSACFAIP